MQLYCNSGGRQRGCPRNCCGAVREVCESWGGPEWAGRGLILLHQVSRRGRGRGRVLCPAQSSRVCNPAAAARKGCWGHLHIHRVPSSHCCALQPVCFLWWSLGLVCVWDFGLGFWVFFLEWELHRILIFILRKSFFLKKNPLLLAAFKYNTLVSHQGSFHSRPGIVVHTAAP